MYVAESYPNVDTSSISETSILTETNTTIINAWCIQSTNFSSTSLQGVCSSYWYTYYINVLITLSISIAIAAFKAILKILVIVLAKFQRYTTQTEQSKNMMKNLMISYIFSTVLITFFVILWLFRCKLMSSIFPSKVLWQLSLPTQHSKQTSITWLSIQISLQIGIWILAIKYGSTGWFLAFNP